MKKILFPLFIISMLVSSLFITGCVDQDFDTPPTDGSNPDIPASAIMTIKDLKDSHVLGTIKQLESDKYISGIVTSSDKEGNFYKQFSIQDETAGIIVLVDMTGTYNTYPVGRRVYIKLNDLYIYDYNNLIQIGGQLNDAGDRVFGIPDVLVEEYILPGMYNQPYTVDTLSISAINADVNNNYVGRIIALKDVEFSVADAGKTYANADALSSLNRALEDCDTDESVIIRTSGYSSFASANTPTKNGTVTAILTVFGDTKQLVIRDTNDVIMTGARCGGGVIGGDADLMTIADLRGEFTGSEVSAPDNKAIKGIVISDRSNGNINGRNVIIQEGSRGILVRFAEDHSFDLGQEITVNTTGGLLSEYNGLLQLSNIENLNAEATGSGTIEPQIVQVSEILNNANDFESTLVKIENPTLSGGATYGGSLTVTGDAEIPMYTSSSASFSGASIPETVTSITAIVGDYNGVQLNLRKLDDVVGTGTGGGGGTEPGEVVETINEDFQASVPTNNVDAAIPGWTNIAVQGERLWRGRIYQNNGYLRATAYQDEAPNMEAWMITPGINLATGKTLNFESAKAFYTHEGLSVWISTDFDGTNFSTATWTQLPATIANDSAENYAFVPSGAIDLSAYSGAGVVAHIGFRYEGSGTNGQTGTFDIDNVIVE